MKTAVVYYSLEGNVRFVAEKVAEGLGGDLVSLVPKKAYPDKGFRKFLWGGKAATMKDQPELEPYRFCADDYDLVVLCSPVWAGTFTPPFRTFLADQDLSQKRVALVASSSGGNADKCLRQLGEAAGVASVVASLGLVDPKDKPSADNEARISAFVERLLACE